MTSISYIITTYNRSQDLLFRAMQSIVMERLDGPNELIIVDDCSSEAAIIPPSIVTAFDGQIQLIRNAQNEGVIKSRNIGLMAAQYEYIFFLDDDDVAYSNRSRNLLAYIKDTSLAFVAGRVCLLDTVNQSKILPYKYDMPLTPLHYLCNIVHINGVIWRRTALLGIGGFDNRVPYFGEQITILLMILRGASVLQVEDVVTQSQPISDGLTQLSSYNDLMRQHLIGLMSALLDEVLPIDFRHICEEVALFLKSQTQPITLDEFLNYLNRQYSSTTSSLTA